MVNNNAGNGDQGLAALLKTGRSARSSARSRVSTTRGSSTSSTAPAQIELEVVPAGQPRRADAGGRRRHRRASSARPGSARRSPRARSSARSTAATTCWSTRIRGDVALIKAHTRRPDGKPRLPQDRPQLRPGDGDRRDHDHRPGRSRSSRPASSTRRRRHARHLRRPGGAAGRMTELAQEGAAGDLEHLDRGPWAGRARRAGGRDIPTGAYVNLGIGQPTPVADHLDPEQRRGAAHRERHARHGPRRRRRRDRPRPDQCRQDPGHRDPGSVVLPPRGLVRDDARRPSRRLRARRFPGLDTGATWRTGTPALRTPSRRWAAPWTSPSAPSRSS